MRFIIIDWQKRTGTETIEEEENHFKLNPLHMRTKDVFNFEMEARMILRTDDDDDSIIIKNFGSFSIFIEKKLNVLFENFFMYKERQDIMTNRLKIKEELVDILQKELTKYNMKIIEFMIVSMSVTQFVVRIPKYWLICYQLWGHSDVNNVVVKDEHPVDYIARQSSGNSMTYNLVNFWEITEDQYFHLSKIPMFIDV